MPNLAQALKHEISRIARKEVREDIAALRKASTSYRSEIAALKRQVKELSVRLRAAQRAVSRAAPAQAPVASREAAAAKGRRGRKRVFNATRLKAKRLALGLSQAQMAQLLGISSLTQWNWETKGVEPRAAKLPRYFEVMAMGKREALRELEA